MQHITHCVVAAAAAAPAASHLFLSSQDCKSEENEMATDNALSTLAALLEHHKDTLDGPHVSQ